MSNPYLCQRCGTQFSSAGMSIPLNGGKCDRCRDEIRNAEAADRRYNEQARAAAAERSRVSGQQAGAAAVAAVHSVADGVAGTVSGIGGGIAAAGKGLYHGFKWLTILAVFAYVYMGKAPWTLLSKILPNKIKAQPWDIANNRLPWREKDWVFGLMVLIPTVGIINLFLSP